MKILLILFSHLLFQNAKSADNCHEWPENLKSLRDCCEVPRYANPVLLNFCYKTKCGNKNLTDDEQNECGARCFTNSTLLLDENGEINKNIVKRIYNINAMYSVDWLKVINETVESSCEFQSSKPLPEGIASYFECVNSHLEKSCVSFIDNLECDKVQEYFEKCNNVTANCNENWPENLMSLEMCCKVPRLYSRRIFDECRGKCYSEEMFEERQMKCIWKCLHDKSNTKVDGKFNFEAVKRSLIANSHNNSHWTNIIEKTVDKCSSMDSDDTLWSCLKNDMSENCVEFHESSGCNKVRRLKTQCPDLKSTQDHHEISSTQAEQETTTSPRTTIMRKISEKSDMQLLDMISDIISNQ